jgi:hypothetical protein
MKSRIDNLLSDQFQRIYALSLHQLADGMMDNFFGKLLTISKKSHDSQDVELEDYLFLITYPKQMAQFILNEDVYSHQRRSPYKAMAFCLAMRDYLMTLPDEQFMKQAGKVLATTSQALNSSSSYRFFHVSGLPIQHSSGDTLDKEYCGTIRTKLVYASAEELPHYLDVLYYWPGDAESEVKFTLGYKQYIQQFANQLKQLSNDVEMYLRSGALNDIVERAKQNYIDEIKFLTALRIFAKNKLHASESQIFGHSLKNIPEFKEFNCPLASQLMLVDYDMLDFVKQDGTPFGYSEKVADFVERNQKRATTKLDEIENLRSQINSILNQQPAVEVEERDLAPSVPGCR